MRINLNQLSIPRLGTSNVGNTSSPIYLSGGYPLSCVNVATKDLATTTSNGLLSSTDKGKIDNELKADRALSSNPSSVYITTDYKKTFYTNVLNTTVTLYIYNPENYPSTANRQWFQGQKVEYYFTYKGTSTLTIQLPTSSSASSYVPSTSIITNGMPARCSAESTIRIEIVYDGTNWIITNCGGADQLNNSITLWGRGFTGRANVSGSISDTGTITPLSKNLYDIGSVTLPFRNIYSAHMMTAIDSLVVFGPALYNGTTSSEILKLDTHRFNYNTGYYVICPPAENSGFIRIYSPGERPGSTDSGYVSLQASKDTNTGVKFGQIGVSSDGNMSHFNISGTLTTNIWGDVPSDLNNYNAYFKGAIRCSTLTGSVSSDRTLKENLEEKDNLSRINSLGEVVDYNYTKEARETHEGLDNKKHIGLIYQNVKDSDIPNLSAQDDDGHGFVNYYSPDLIATLIGAVQQLSKEVKFLKEQLKEE